jgi:G3E family GTPase
MIKVDIISGFLGAGKTTIIKKLLKAYENEKVVLIENEFGEIGVDGELVEREGFEVFEISSGCICCIMQKDFIDMLSRIIKEFKPQRIIIEPTGISILSDILDILNRPEFSRVLSINSLVTVVDSVNYLDQVDIFGEFFEDQITNAKTLLLSKSQLVEEAKRNQIIGSLRERNQGAILITSNWTDLSIQDIKNITNSDIHIDFQDLLNAEHRPCRENEFKTFAIETRKRYTIEELKGLLEELTNPIYGTVLRGKGFLKGEKCYMEFSYTNGQQEIKENQSKTSGRLCLIGKDLNEQALKKLFQVKDGGIFNWLKF